MKINKTRYSQLTTTAAIACMLAINCGANAAPKKTRARDVDNKSTLDEAARTNHNSLLPASFYESNHESNG